MASVSVGVCNELSTVIVREPVGVAVLEADPDATVIVTKSLAPAARVVAAADRIVFDDWFPVTVTVTDPAEAVYLESPE